VGRHRHAVNVRADGLATVLGPLAQDPAVLVALLVDVDSGMVLDSCGPAAAGGDAAGAAVPPPAAHPDDSHSYWLTEPAAALADTEELGAAHGELMRLALGVATGSPVRAGRDCELTVSLDGHRHLVLRRVPDPHGDRLVLSVLVDGPARIVKRVRRRLGEMSAAAFTAGPTVSLRPGLGAWVSGRAAPAPAVDPAGEPPVLVPRRLSGIPGLPALGVPDPLITGAPSGQDDAPGGFPPGPPPSAVAQAQPADGPRAEPVSDSTDGIPVVRAADGSGVVEDVADGAGAEPSDGGGSAASGSDGGEGPAQAGKGERPPADGGQDASPVDGGQDASAAPVGEGPKRTGAPGPSDGGVPGRPPNGMPGPPVNGVLGGWVNGMPGRPANGAPMPPRNGAPGPMVNGMPGRPANAAPGPVVNGMPGRPVVGAPGPRVNGMPARSMGGAPDPGTTLDGAPGSQVTGMPGRPADGAPGPGVNGMPGRPPDTEPERQDNGRPDQPGDAGREGDGGRPPSRVPGLVLPRLPGSPRGEPGPLFVPQQQDHRDDRDDPHRATDPTRPAPPSALPPPAQTSA
jgi:hypothetical protein